MERQILEAALSVLSSCAAKEPPNKGALAIVKSQHANPEGMATDEMARLIVEEFLLDRGRPTKRFDLTSMCA